MICAFATSFVPRLAKYLSPAYAVLEGFVLGGFRRSSMTVQGEISEYHHGGCVADFGVAFAVFLLYNFRVIRATNKFKAVILVFDGRDRDLLCVDIVLGFFGVRIPFMQLG